MGYIVALTGGIGSGKSTVADAFSRLGITIIDADIICPSGGRARYTRTNAIKAHFGQAIINADGTLNRRKLRECIFLILQKRHVSAPPHYPPGNPASDCRSPLAVCSVGGSLLVENQLHNKADRVLVIDVSPKRKSSAPWRATMSRANRLNKFLPLRPRALSALPLRMMLLIITAHQMPLHRMLPACTRSI